MPDEIEIARIVQQLKRQGGNFSSVYQVVKEKYGEIPFSYWHFEQYLKMQLPPEQPAPPYQRHPTVLPLRHPTSPTSSPLSQFSSGSTSDPYSGSQREIATRMKEKAEHEVLQGTMRLGRYGLAALTTLFILVALMFAIRPWTNRDSNAGYEHVAVLESKPRSQINLKRTEELIRLSKQLPYGDARLLDSYGFDISGLASPNAITGDFNGNEKREFILRASDGNNGKLVIAEETGKIKHLKAVRRTGRNQRETRSIPVKHTKIIHTIPTSGNLLSRGYLIIPHNIVGDERQEILVNPLDERDFKIIVAAGNGYVSTDWTRFAEDLKTVEELLASGKDPKYIERELAPILQSPLGRTYLETVLGNAIFVDKQTQGIDFWGSVQSNYNKEKAAKGVGAKGVNPLVSVLVDYALARYNLQFLSGEPADFAKQVLTDVAYEAGTSLSFGEPANNKPDALGRKYHPVPGTNGTIWSFTTEQGAKQIGEDYARKKQMESEVIEKARTGQLMKELKPSLDQATTIAAAEISRAISSLSRGGNTSQLQTSVNDAARILEPFGRDVNSAIQQAQQGAGQLFQDAQRTLDDLFKPR